MTPSLQVVSSPFDRRVQPGDDLATLLTDTLAQATWPDGSTGLTDGDIVVITSKIISKAEGQIIAAASRDEAIDAEAVRVVAQRHTARGTTKIVQTHHGLIMAAAGVDASNVEAGHVVLLPKDPDLSARVIAAHLRQHTGFHLGVVITDTMGRPWRMGVTDVAIGSAGVGVLDDHTGRVDSFGRTLEMTVIAVADEIAAAADLVKGKTSDRPVAIVRGLAHYVSTDLDAGCSQLIRPIDEDLFPLGTREAMLIAPAMRRTVRQFSDAPVPIEIVNEAICSASTAPAPHGTKPWRFLVLEHGDRRTALLDAMREQWREDLQSDSALDEAAVNRRLARGDLLRTSPLVVIPFIDLQGAHSYADEPRTSAERDMFIVAGGAAIQNFMISVAANGGGTAWIGSTLFCADTVRASLGYDDTLIPLGAIAVGMPLHPSQPRDPSDASEFTLK